ncbi:MAG: lanthionine synthetase LanC family protein [Gemmatimonadota bacterium]
MGTETFLQAAVQIGAALVAENGREGAASFAPESPLDTSTDLYRGAAGVALFLIELDRAEPHADFRRVAETVLAHALTATCQPRRLGFYDGILGIAYVAARAGQLWQRPDLLKRAEAIVHQIEREECEMVKFDALSGAAGMIPALIELGDGLDPDLCYGIAERLGERLLGTAIQEPWGWCWQSPAFPCVKALTGFGQGAAGVGRACLELHRAIQDDRYLYAAEQTFLYEQRFFSAAHENWLDLRLDDATVLHQSTSAAREQRSTADKQSPYLGSFAVGWCHGAVGIGLARVRAYDLLRQPVYRSEAQAAVSATLKALTTTDNVALCHGLSGYGELLLYGAQVFETASWRAQAEQIGTYLIAGLSRRPVPSAGVAYPAASGLMSGSAGVGYFLLRLHDARTPSVLLPGLVPVAASETAPRASAERGPAYMELCRIHVDRFWRQSLQVLDKLHSASGGTPAALTQQIDDAVFDSSCETSAPVSVYRAICRAAELGATESMDPAIDSLALERARFELSLEVVDHSSAKAYSSQPVTVEMLDWGPHTTVYLAPHARLIRTRRKTRDVTKTGVPSGEPAGYVLVRKQEGIATILVDSLSTSLLAHSAAEPISLARLSAAVASTLGGALDTVSARVITVAKELYSLQALDVLGSSFSDHIGSILAAALQQRVPTESLFQHAGGLVGRAVRSTTKRLSGEGGEYMSDRTLRAYMLDLSAYELATALNAACLGPIFRRDMIDYWETDSERDRRRILLDLTSRLTRIFRYPAVTRATYLSEPEIGAPPDAEVIDG